MNIQQGAIETLYYYLWLTNDGQKHNQVEFHLPQTIIYRMGIIQTWYFTNQNKEIQVKKIENRTPQNALKSFMSNFQNDIVALFIPCRHKKEFYHTYQTRSEFLVDQMNLDCETSVQYLNEKDFKEFILYSDQNRNGILQQFVQPHLNESVIQSVWSTNALIMSQRVNYRQIENTKFDVNERCATFNSSDIYSRAQPVKTKYAHDAIRKMIEYIVEKVKFVSYEQHIINRAVFYCKFDKNNKLNLLYCTSLRTNQEYPFPILIGLQNRPDNVKNAITTNTLKPVEITKRLICIYCMKLCQQGDLSEVTYDLIIDRKLKNRMDIKKYSTPLITNPSDDKDIFIEEYVANTTKLIPDIFKKLFPKLKYDKYVELCKNDAFRQSTLLICENCFLKLSKPPTNIVVKLPISKCRSITDLIKKIKVDSTRQELQRKISETTRRQEIDPPATSREELSKFESIKRAKSARSTRIQSGYTRIVSSKGSSPQRKQSIIEQ